MRRVVRRLGVTLVGRGGGSGGGRDASSSSSKRSTSSRASSSLSRTFLMRLGLICICDQLQFEVSNVAPAIFGGWGASMGWSGAWRSHLRRAHSDIGLRMSD
jgi:hypothetical protein